MAETIRTIEATPAEWPDATTPTWAWQRIESWCSTRWTPREVVWLIDGTGDWSPPLTPFRLALVESWANAWTPSQDRQSPWGHLALTGDMHRITAIVGENNPASPAVLEAARRLMDHVTAMDRKPGFTSYSVNVGQITESWRRDAAGFALAMQQSGAADLLRPYRRAR